jgi:uncharacterized membrane protein
VISGGWPAEGCPVECTAKTPTFPLTFAFAFSLAFTFTFTLAFALAATLLEGKGYTVDLAGGDCDDLRIAEVVVGGGLACICADIEIGE